MDKFWFTNTGYPRPNTSGRAGYMAESRQVAKISSIILDKSISKTEQVLARFKSVSHHSLIENVKNASLIVPSKEIKVSVVHETNKKPKTKRGSENKIFKEEKQTRNKNCT